MSDKSLLNPDGSNFRPSASDVDYIVKNQTIDTFIKSNEDSSVVVIVGEKGSGKSVLINLKSFQDRNDTKKKGINRRFIPESGITKIAFDGQLSAKDIKSNVNISDWEKIFNVSFYYYILSQIKDELIEEKIISEATYQSHIPFHKHFNELGISPAFIQFGTILTKAILGRRILNEKETTFIGFAKTLISAYVHKKELYVYFDNLDQALYKAFHSEKNKETDSEILYNNLIQITDENLQSPENKMVSSWLNCHIGYFIALHNINELDRKLKVFSTFRLEAYEYLQLKDVKNKPQLRGIACPINYSPQDYQEIYRQLIRYAKIEESKLAELELKELPHIWVKNSIYNKESLWEFIKRHTFGNPREITYQIKAIKEAIPSLEAINNVKDRVRKFKIVVSKKAFFFMIQDLESETLPFFPSEELEKLQKEKRKNWLTKSEITGIEKIITILYRLGLIGVVEKRGNNYYQRFLGRNVYYSNKKMTLPDSLYYLFHPILDHRLLRLFPNDSFYYPHCIIGHGNMFHLLREKEYYLPKNSGEKAEAHFIAFYEKEGQFIRYGTIQENMQRRWLLDVWDFYFGIREGKIIDHLQDKINSGKPLHGKRNRDSDKNLFGLMRNYQLRIMITYVSLIGLIKSHTKMKTIFKGDNEFADKTFFNDIRKDGNKINRYIAGLSEFELDIIRYCLDNPILSKDLNNKMRWNDSLKRSYREKIRDMRGILESYL